VKKRKNVSPFTFHALRITFQLASAPRAPNLLRMENPDPLRELSRLQKSLNERSGGKTDGMNEEEKTEGISPIKGIARRALEREVR
jgi:hypothetical protein